MPNSSAQFWLDRAISEVQTCFRERESPQPPERQRVVRDLAALRCGLGHSRGEIFSGRRENTETLPVLECLIL
jgi:hypothetical protein